LTERKDSSKDDTTFDPEVSIVATVLKCVGLACNAKNRFSENGFFGAFGEFKQIFHLIEPAIFVAIKCTIL